MTRDLILSGMPSPVSKSKHPLAEFPMPDCMAVHGAAGQFCWEEFFAGKLRNIHTRRSYLQAVTAFLSWCEQYQVELQAITPGLIGRYFDQHTGSAPTKKLHMSAIRGFFHVLVNGMS